MIMFNLYTDSCCYRKLALIFKHCLNCSCDFTLLKIEINAIFSQIHKYQSPFIHSLSLSLSLSLNLSLTKQHRLTDQGSLIKHESSWNSSSHCYDPRSPSHQRLQTPLSIYHSAPSLHTHTHTTHTTHTHTHTHTHTTHTHTTHTTHTHTHKLKSSSLLIFKGRVHPNVLIS